MKPSTTFGIRTILILTLSVGLGLAFNATRPDMLPLVRTQESTTGPALQEGEISMGDARQLFISKEAVFVDAREADVYAQGHIEGALSLPVFSFAQDFGALKNQMEGKAIITYCDGEFCELSRDLADQLKAHGLQNVYVLKNGWTLWRNEGLPTATGGGTGQQEPAPQEPMPQEPMPQEPGQQDPVPPEPMRQESVPQEQMLPESAPGQAMPQDPALQAPVPQQPEGQGLDGREPDPQEPKPMGEHS